MSANTVTINENNVQVSVSENAFYDRLTKMLDFPASYTGKAGKYVRVKSDETGVEFVSAAGGGEANTASNQGAGGIGLYKQKVDVDLQFKNINAGSAKITITDDPTNSEVDVDVAEAQLTLDNLGGLALTNRNITPTKLVIPAAGVLIIYASDGTTPVMKIYDNGNIALLGQVISI